MAEFTQAQLEELCIPDICIDQEVIEEGRWTLTRTGVAQIDGTFYRFTWEDPATEMQDIDDIWMYADPVTAVEVAQREVTVMQWVPVDEVA